MPGQYERIPNPSGRHPHQDLDDEVEAAFDYREDDDDNDASESQPLNRNASHTSSTPPPIRTVAPQPAAPGAYNFEIVDYDYPPPGSPPPLSAQAFPNDWGNSNGMVPDFSSNPVPQPRQPWWKRAASILPESVSSRLVGPSRPTGAVGGGINNDGVFANVVAKPTAPVRVHNGDDTYVVPEDAQNEAPPSYASAQADAVPPYWETTIHAPFAPESMGEMIVDSLPTGSVFAFGWNLLVSVSFQFVGFLLTYLLHTSHAARLGSRAGLGITLIQYGFALRGKLDGMEVSDGRPAWSDPWKPINEPTPTPTSSEDSWLEPSLANGTDSPGNSIPIPGDDPQNVFADATAEWLSFFLMTIGWFVLLTSVLGFYRVKRWERSILATQQRENPGAAASAVPTTAASTDGDFAIRGMSRIEVLRAGFGFGSRRETEREESRLMRAEAGASPTGQQQRREEEVIDPSDPRYEVWERDRRVLHALRDSGLI